MILALALGSLVAATTAGIVVVLRRRSPDKIEVVSSSSNNNVTVRQESSLPESEELKTAFLEGDDFYWMVDSDEKKHRILTFYMIECVIRVAQRYGYIVVQRDTETGAYQGSVSIMPPGTPFWQGKLQFLASVTSMGRPPVDLWGGIIKERFYAFGQSTEEHHHSVMATPEHWYIITVGVAPTAQGKGVGRNLLNTAIQTIENADPVRRRPIYLECHDGNVPFYEKMGFNRERRFALNKSSKETNPYYYNSMVYRFPE